MAGGLVAIVHFVAEGGSLQVKGNSHLVGFALLKPVSYTHLDVYKRQQWSIAALPSVPWAKKVFPELDADAAMEALWKLIFDEMCIRDRLRMARRPS